MSPRGRYVGAQLGDGGQFGVSIRQRLETEWRDFRLAGRPEAGYAPGASRLEDLVREAVRRNAKPASPTLVWIYDRYDDKANNLLESKIWRDERVGLALKRFVCLRGDAQDLPVGTMRNEVKRRLPVLFLFSPGGKPFCVLEGKRAMSRSTFYSRLEKLWGDSFTMTLRTYTKAMFKILDRLDGIGARMEVLWGKAEKAADKPAKLAAVKRAMAELEKEEKKVLEDEERILAACAPRPEFRPSAEAASK